MNNLFCSRVWPSTLAVFLVLLLISPSRAETWPRFRGPNGSGVGTAKSMPTSWTKDDYLWRVELPGSGYSSPVVWNDRVYVTSGDEKEGTQIVQAFDTKTGELVWEQPFKADPYKKHRLNSYATSTPVLDAEKIYVTWGGPKGSTVVALDRATGDEKWRYEMGPYVAMHNFAASPMLVDDVVVVLNDQDKHRMLVALDRATGEVKWKSEEDSEADATYSTPCIFQPPGAAAQLIVGRTLAGLSSLDPRTGKENWNLDLSFKYRLIGSPIMLNDRLVVTCGSGGGGLGVAVVQAGVPENNVEPTILYNVKKDLPYVPTPLLHDGLLYLWSDSAKVKCIELDSGKELWKGRLRGKFYSSPVLVDGKLYGISDKGKVFVLAAGQEFKELGKVDLGEKTMATPAVADGVMYLRTLTHLMALPGKS